ncbi:glyoxalase family protein [Striga asiatica]|uniref:Glyoxalase family protein n=1 Tax=Striga asiatica TaxID=4170 RepID=A0A5A7QCZ4_STRAF|nr:glyoxalase family protein [Striga asiatica]
MEDNDIQFLVIVDFELLLASSSRIRNHESAGFERIEERETFIFDAAQRRQQNALSALKMLSLCYEIRVWDEALDLLYNRDVLMGLWKTWPFKSMYCKLTLICYRSYKI